MTFCRILDYSTRVIFSSQHWPLIDNFFKLVVCWRFVIQLHFFIFNGKKFFIDQLQHIHQRTQNCWFIVRFSLFDIEMLVSCIRCIECNYSVFTFILIGNFVMLEIRQEGVNCRRFATIRNCFHLLLRMNFFAKKKKLILFEHFLTAD